ncbi:protein of unknown function [Shewanella benthica]|uniref:Transposase n=1 Tax=Shewanella benthica TaxID=43661 RepID=A0A330MA41_9GAMM|nr:protein of unknown function [Shewanella benthica]
MPRPRRTQVSIEDTPMYHCCSRVTRRASRARSRTFFEQKRARFDDLMQL